jgi:hypothetical protein
MTDYSEFRIRIEPGPSTGSYRVQASGLGGDGKGEFKSPFSDESLENFILKVGRTRRGVRRIASPEWESAKTFGGRLFSAVMQGRVLELYRGALIEAQTTKKSLRVTLALSDVPELAEIPWEYLYDAPNFLSISTSTPVVRYLDVPKPQRPLQIELPIRILAVVSAPSDAEELKTDVEKANLETALKPLIDAKAVAIDWLEEATLLALAKKLRPDSYHILHFIGHGGFDNASDEGALLFEDDAGRGRIVSGEQLATVLHDKTSLRLVFLNSCEGARTSRKDPFSGVAASLVQREVPAVIGMQFEITDRAAIIFAGEFYTMLAEGQPVDVAVTQARLTVFADQNDVEWGTPVLFMRVADGQLFDVAHATALPRADAEVLPPKVVDPGAGVPPVQVPVPTPAATAVPTKPEVSPPAPAVVAAATELQPAAPREDVMRTSAAADPAAERARLAAEETDRIELQRLVAPPRSVPAAPAEHAWTAPLPSRVPWRKVAVGVVVAVAILTVIGLLLPSPSTGSISVSVNGTEQTGLLSVIGSGFEPRENVDLYLDGVNAATVVAGSDGSFNTQLFVGTRQSGKVSAVGRTSSHQANSDFLVSFVAASSPADPSGPTPTGVEPTVLAGPISPGILFYSNAEPGSSETDYELYVIDPVTGAEQQLTRNQDTDDTFPTWSPDYAQIAFSRVVDGTRDIFILDGTSERQLTSGGTDDWFPAWSRDGWIAFVRQVPGETDSTIWLIRSDGSDEHQILSGGRLRTPAWTVDGKTLALTTNLFRSDFDVTAVEADGTGRRQVSVGSTSDRNPTWSADGRTILFVHDRKETGDADNDLYLLNVAKKKVSKQLTNNNVQDGNPVWSSDGTQIAFYRATADGYHIWVMDANGTNPHDLMPERPGRNLDPNWR